MLDLVILFYLFIFFLGREAQKVREYIKYECAPFRERLATSYFK